MRNLDGKFRLDGEKILHPSGAEIPMDEPLWLFRARDQFALQTLRYYLKVCKAHGCTQYQLEGIKTAMDKFGEFKRNHSDHMKQPGITQGR